MSSGAPIGPLGIAPSQYDPVWMQQFVERLEQIHILLSQPAQTGYTVANGTTDRTLDVTGDTLAQGLAVLGTLIEDMKSKGTLG